MRKYIITIMSGGEAHKPNGFCFFFLFLFKLVQNHRNEREKKRRICLHRPEEQKREEKKIAEIYYV